MIIYKPKDGIWVRSKTTRIAYEVEAIEIVNNRISKVYIENITSYGDKRKEWWNFKHFDLLTPIQIDTELIVTILYKTTNISEEKVIKLR